MLKLSVYCNYLLLFCVLHRTLDFKFSESRNFINFITAAQADSITQIKNFAIVINTQ